MKSREEYLVDSLDLSPIFDNLQDLEREFNFTADEVELQDSDNNYYFANVQVIVKAKLNYEDNSVTIEDKFAAVEFDEVYFGSDKDGGELELCIESDAGIVSDLIEKRILDYLK